MSPYQEQSGKETSRSDNCSPTAATSMDPPLKSPSMYSRGRDTSGNYQYSLESSAGAVSDNFCITSNPCNYMHLIQIITQVSTNSTTIDVISLNRRVFAKLSIYSLRSDYYQNHLYLVKLIKSCFIITVPVCFRLIVVVSFVSQTVHFDFA